MSGSSDMGDHEPTTPTLGAPSFSRLLRKGWETTNLKVHGSMAGCPTHDFRRMGIPKKLGAPCLDLQTWETTNLQPQRWVPHPFRVFCEKGGRPRTSKCTARWRDSGRGADLPRQIRSSMSASAMIRGQPRIVSGGMGVCRYLSWPPRWELIDPGVWRRRNSTSSVHCGSRLALALPNAVRRRKWY